MQNLISALQDRFKSDIYGVADEKNGVYTFDIHHPNDNLPNRRQFQSEILQILEESKYFPISGTRHVFSDGDVRIVCMDGDLTEWGVFIGQHMPNLCSIISFIRLSRRQ